MQATGARAGDILVWAPFDQGDVDAGQRQFSGQHQAGGAAAYDDYGMFGHGFASRCDSRSLLDSESELPETSVNGKSRGFLRLGLANGKNHAHSRVTDFYPSTVPVQPPKLGARGKTCWSCHSYSYSRR